jgi:hypothetical protein
MSDNNDERIARLPQWAQQMIHDGDTAKQSVDYWRKQTDEARAEADRLRQEHARERGAEQYDTWTAADGHEVEEIRFGLGMAEPVYFGDSGDTCEEFRVTYRDHGLDISMESAGIIIKPPKYGDPTLRVEFE